jgi:hypothetical protein
MHSEHTPQEVRKLILDREARRSRIEVIVAANTKVEYRKREDNEIRRGKTSSAIVATLEKKVIRSKVNSLKTATPFN